MVGIVSCSEISLAILAGTASNSSMKHPASSIANASSRIFIAASAVRPWILNPPNIAMVCGVNPMWEAVGMPAHHVHGGWDSAGVAVSDHGEAIAYHCHVDTGHFRPFCRRIVGDRHVDHLFPGPF